MHHVYVVVFELQETMHLLFCIQERDAKVQKIIEAEFEIELGVELEEVAAMLNSSNPELKELKLRLEAMEERILKLEPALQQSRKAPQNSVERLTISPETGKQPAALQVFIAFTSFPQSRETLLSLGHMYQIAEHFMIAYMKCVDKASVVNSKHL